MQGQSMSAAARAAGLCPETVRKRVVYLGWDLERALSTKPWETRRGVPVAIRTDPVPRDERCPGPGPMQGDCGKRASAGPAGTLRYCPTCWAWLSGPVAA